MGVVEGVFLAVDGAGTGILADIGGGGGWLDLEEAEGTTREEEAAEEAEG